MVGKANIIKVKYQSSSPGSHWIKVSDANKLRDKAVQNKAKEIFEDIGKIRVTRRKPFFRVSGLNGFDRLKRKLQIND